MLPPMCCEAAIGNQIGRVRLVRGFPDAYLRDPHSHPINLHLEVSIDAVQTPRFNIAPHNKIVIGLRDDRAGRRDVQLMERSAVFGFLPHWAKLDTRPQINARAETVAEKPYFRTAFAKHRCLVPADGWYEWKVIAGKKAPYFIRRPDDVGFYFAGLYSAHLMQDGATQFTFCIITTEASTDLVDLHDRMPLVIDDAHWMEWLRDDSSAKILKSLLIPSLPGTFQAYPVSTRVNNPRNDDLGCIEHDDDRK